VSDEVWTGLVDTGFWVARQQGDTALHDSIYHGFQPRTRPSFEP
jgi:hypothetical protein